MRGEGWYLSVLAISCLLYLEYHPIVQVGCHSSMDASVSRSIRAMFSEWEGWAKAASRKGLSLNRWARISLNKAAHEENTVNPLKGKHD